MAEDDRDWVDSLNGWGRNVAQFRNGGRTSIAPPPPDYLFRLKDEHWHKVALRPFRAGLAITPWQTTQASLLMGKPVVQRDSETLIALALAANPQPRGGWVLAALAAQKILRQDEDSTTALVSITDLSFANATHEERDELLSALIECVQQAVKERWQIQELKVNESVLKKHAHWLKDHTPDTISAHQISPACTVRMA